MLAYRISAFFKIWRFKSGFKYYISSKIIGFGSHISVTNFTNNQSYENDPISINQDFLTSIKKHKGIKNINTFATKAGIIKTREEIHGVVLKGVTSDYNWSFFNNNLVAGELPFFDSKKKSSQFGALPFLSSKR